MCSSILTGLKITLSEAIHVLIAWLLVKIINTIRPENSIKRHINVICNYVLLRVPFEVIIYFISIYLFCREDLFIYLERLF